MLSNLSALIWTIRKLRNCLLVLFIVIFSQKVWATIEVRTIDVGPGLCIIIKDHLTEKVVLYDAGRWDNDFCYLDLYKNMPNQIIDLVILSHSDSDHIGNITKILNRFTPNIVIHTGYERERIKTWRKANQSISESSQRGTSVINLSSLGLEQVKRVFEIGNFKVELLSGGDIWYKSADKSDVTGLSESKLRNSISITAKLSAYGKSLLFTGDIVGRKETDDDEYCSYSEKYLVDSYKKMNSDVLFLPHHGANNASSKCFIEAVSPSYMIISAGHKYSHPRSSTLNRSLNALGIPKENVLRTDRGDDEGRLEWGYLRIPGCKDVAGDDNIVTFIKPSGELLVSYENQDNSCS